MTKLLRLPEVMARTGVSRSSLYLEITCGTFPKQILIGSRTVGWIEEEVEGWIQDRIRCSRKDNSVVKKTELDDEV
jgi:prophage regulatory protein